MLFLLKLSSFSFQLYLNLFFKGLPQLLKNTSFLISLIILFQVCVPELAEGNTREKCSAHACIPCFRREFAIEITRDIKTNQIPAAKFKKVSSTDKRYAQNFTNTKLNCFSFSLLHHILSSLHQRRKSCLRVHARFRFILKLNINTENGDAGICLNERLSCTIAATFQKSLLQCIPGGLTFPALKFWMLIKYDFS